MNNNFLTHSVTLKILKILKTISFKDIEYRREFGNYYGLDDVDIHFLLKSIEEEFDIVITEDITIRNNLFKLVQLCIEIYDNK